MAEGQQSPQRGTKRGRPSGGCPDPVSEKQQGRPPPPPPAQLGRPPPPPPPPANPRSRPGYIADAVGKSKGPDLPGVKPLWNGASLGLQTPEGGKVQMTTGVSPPKLMNFVAAP